MPGVITIYTAADLTGYGAMPFRVALQGRGGAAMAKPPRFALATDKVRFVGDPVACVIAQTAAQAQDAAEAVTLDIEPLPAIVAMSDAVKPDAPQIYGEAPGNVALDYHFGDSEKVTEAFAKAAHVTKLKITNSRIVITLGDLTTSGLGISQISLQNSASALQALSMLDTAIGSVNSTRSVFGAVQNRFQNVISNLMVATENQSAARSRIMDADYAAETANLSRAQILQQAGNAMVAQANQLPQQVLSLLQR
jgi:flagellin-like hook-associated protein FlgL